MFTKIRPITGRNKAHLDPSFGKPAMRQLPVKPNELGDGDPPKFKQATCVNFKKKFKPPQSKKAKREIERRRQVAEVNGLKRQIEQDKLSVDPRLEGLASNWLEKAEMWELY